MKKTAYFTHPKVHPSLKTWLSNIVIPVGDYVISFSGDDGVGNAFRVTSLRHYLMIWHKDSPSTDLTEEFGFENYGNYDLTKIIDTVNRKIIKDRVKVLENSKESIQDANDREQSILHNSFAPGSIIYPEELMAYEEEAEQYGVDPQEEDITVENNRKQVDFDLLKDNFNIASVFFEKHMSNRPELQENFDLFVKMMQKSSSFAHKAHKELKKLK